MYLWLLYILRLFIGLFSGHIGLVSPDLQHNLPSVPTQKRYYIQNGSHKYCISDKVHADDDEVRMTVMIPVDSRLLQLGIEA